MENLRKIFLISLLIPTSFILGVQKGSESALSIEQHAVFPAGEDNKMLAFGWFKNGFTLADATTTCTFDSTFPVMGHLHLNGGQLVLDADINLNNVSYLDTSGKIDGQFHLLDVSESVTGIPAHTDTVLKDLHLFLNSDLHISGTVKIQGNCTLNGRKNRITLDSDAQLIIDKDATLKIKNAELYGVNSHKLYCIDDSADIHLDNMRFVQTGNYTFSNGSFLIMNQVDFAGPYVFKYDSDLTSTIQADSTLYLSDIVTFEVGRKNGIYGHEPLYFEETDSSLLEMKNSTFSVTSSGLRLTHGTLLGDGEISFSIDSTGTTNALIFGDGTADGDFKVKLKPEASINFVDGDIVYDVVEFKNFLTTNVPVNFVQAADARFHGKQNLSFNSIHVKKTLDNNFFLDSGKVLEFENVVFKLPIVEYEVTATWQNVLNNLYAGGNSVHLKQGSFLLTSNIQGASNKIYGDGDVVGNINFLDNDAELTLDISGKMSGSVDLAGAKIVISSDIDIANTTFENTTGTISAGSNVINFSAEDFNFTSTLTFEGSGATFCMNSNIKLYSQLNFVGDWTIMGRGNEFEFAETGTIHVYKNSCLHFRDVLVKGLSDGQLCCFDNSGTIILDQTKIFMDADYSFTLGAMQIKNSVDFFGAYKFIYNSALTSTIDHNSRLHISPDSTLRVGRKESYGMEPIYFVDQSAELLINNANIEITPSGMQLTRGVFSSLGNVTVSIESTSTQFGLILGDGTVEGDLLAEWHAAAAVSVPKGHLTYKITTPGGIHSQTNDTKLAVGTDFVFNVEENITLDSLTIATTLGWELILAPGKILGYNDYIVTFPGIKYQITGYHYDDISNHLAGNGEIIVESGVLPLVSIVTGAGNYIHGGGNIGAPIYLIGPTAELDLGIFGRVFADVNMSGGTLSISKMFGFGNGNTIKGYGTVDLDDKVMLLIGTDYLWTSTLTWETDKAVMLCLNACNIDLSGEWRIKGDCILDGSGSLLNLGSTGNIIVERDSRLTLKNVKINRLSGSQIECAHQSGQVVFEDSVLIMDDDYSFTCGSILFKSDVDICGGCIFELASDFTSTIDSLSSLQITNNSILKLSKNNPYGLEPLYCEAATSNLWLDNATLKISDTGARLTRGKIVLNREVTFDINSTSTINGLLIGDSTALGDMIVQWNAGSTVKVPQGHITFENVDPDSFDARTRNTRAYLGSTVSLNIHEDINLKNLSIESIPGWELKLADGKELTYDNYTAIFPGIKYEITGKRYNEIANYLAGDSEIIITTGAVPLVTVVSGAGNKMHGLGGIAAPVFLLDANTELTLDVLGDVLADITLGSGKITLQKPLKFGHDKVFVGQGTVDLTNEVVEISGEDLHWTSTIYWDGTTGVVKLRSRSKMTSCWTFSGDCILDGNGYELDLDELGRIIIERGSQLTIKDLKISGLGSEQLCCLDNAAKVVFDNVKWTQDSDLTFSLGSFRIKDALTMCGNAKFVYSSDQTSHITRRSTLYLDEDFEFSYAPQTTSRTLLMLDDQTSKLALNGATLHSTATGIQLINGILEVKGLSKLSSDAQYSVEGIICGDGVDIDNNLTIDIFPKSTLELIKGHILYKNLT